MADPDHRAAAAALFNAAWDLLDDAGRGATGDREMLAAALGSWYHWRQVGTPRNWAISDWQVSRVFAVLGDANWARRFAQANLDLCDEHDLDPFVRGYAYEALARAAAVAGDDAARAGYTAQAVETAAAIDKPDDRQALLADLEMLGTPGGL